MINFYNKKGVAVPEYALIAILFAVVLGIAVFQVSPDVLKKFFVRSVDENAVVNDGKLQMKTLGE